jgi:glycosyltransferase involved in cell wall biosynthesis
MAQPIFAAMVIAINIRVLSGDEAASGLLINWCENLAAENSEHQFYIISNEAIPVSSLSNVKSLVIRQQSSSPLLWKIWYNYSLPAVLKKIKSNLLISAGGAGSLRTTLPQCIIVNDLAFFDHPEWYSKRYVQFSKAHLPLVLNKAAAVLTFSAHIKNEIINRFAVDQRKIILAPAAGTRSQPISLEEKEKVKSKYSGGNEYFLFCGAIHNRQQLTHLLKAFSLFKKRQKSSMQLLLVTDKIPVKSEFVDSLRLYKYRQEVQLLTDITNEERDLITAAAWSVVGFSPMYSDIHFLKQAVTFEVPVISGDTPLAIELLQDAALYATASSIDSIAEQLMIIYKDENRHAGLVENGRRLTKTVKAENPLEMILSLTKAG